MNMEALANTLRHVLFLLVLLKFLNGIVLIVGAEACNSFFHQYEFLPLEKNLTRDAFYIALDFATIIFNATGFASIVLSVLGFVGAVYLHRYPTINFSMGMCATVMASAEFGSVAIVTNFIHTVDNFVPDNMNKLFRTSNTIVFPKIVQASGMGFVAPRDPETGWSVLANGTDEEHLKIDYYQINLQCCGLTGRQFYSTKVPTSCCPPPYANESCLISLAYTRSCLYYYKTFLRQLTTLRTEFLVFGLISIFTVACALYLTHLKMKYPDGKYVEDSSSSSSESDNDEDAL